MCLFFLNEINYFLLPVYEGAVTSHKNYPLARFFCYLWWLLCLFLCEDSGLDIHWLLCPCALPSLSPAKSIPYTQQHRSLQHGAIKRPVAITTQTPTLTPQKDKHQQQKQVLCWARQQRPLLCFITDKTNRVGFHPIGKQKLLQNMCRNVVLLLA